MEKARDKAEAECGIKSIEHKRAAKEAIQKKIQSPQGNLRDRKTSQETKMEEGSETADASDEAQAKILKEVPDRRGPPRPPDAVGRGHVDQGPVRGHLLPMGVPAPVRHPRGGDPQRGWLGRATRFIGW